MPNNIYKLSTATTIANGGLGGDQLTKPAGVETASIVPGKKYSNYIPSAATFVTSFNFDEPSKTFLMYCKPNVGNVLSVADIVVEYTGNSFRVANEVGDVAEIATSPAAHILSLTISQQHIGLAVDGTDQTIPVGTTDVSGPVTVTLLESGGILDMVMASATPIPRLSKMLDEFTNVNYFIENNSFMFDEYRDFAVEIPVEGSFVSEGPLSITLPPANAEMYKVNFLQSGTGGVSVNEEPYSAGEVISGTLDGMTIMGDPWMQIDSLVVTKYLSDEIGATGTGSVIANGVTGITAPPHAQHDWSLADPVTVTLEEPVQVVGGWFKDQDGSPLPGVAMDDGILTGTGLYVNGKPYSGGAIHGMYFLILKGEQSGSFDTGVPTYSIYVSEEDMTDTQIDDAYESFFGNPTAEAPGDTVSIIEHPAMIISTEWDILGSG